MAVKIRRMCPDGAEINETINRPKWVILRNMLLQRDLVKQGRLRL